MAWPLFLNGFFLDVTFRYYYIRQGWYLLKYDAEKNTTELHERRTNVKELKTKYEECVLARSDFWINMDSTDALMTRVPCQTCYEGANVCSLPSTLDSFGSMVARRGMERVGKTDWMGKQMEMGTASQNRLQCLVTSIKELKKMAKKHSFVSIFPKTLLFEANQREQVVVQPVPSRSYFC